MIKILKAITAVACAAFFLCSCESVPEQTPEQMAISSVYKLDSRICGDSRSVAEIVAKLQSIQTSGCPQTFASAFYDYTHAWEKLASVEKKMYDANMQKATKDMEAFINGFRDESIGKAVVALKKQWPAFSKEIDGATSAISKSFAALTSAGASYDVVYKKTSSEIF